METTEKHQYKNRERLILGLALLVVGSVLLMGQFGLDYPHWIFSWPMILIVIGIAKAFRHGSKNFSWLILLAIGGLFLAEKIDPSLSVGQFTWPIILIAIGLVVLFGKSPKNCEKYRQKWRRQHGLDPRPYHHEEQFGDSFSQKKNDEPVTPSSPRNSDDEVIESITFFGGAKKSIFSKNFKGGEVITFMGGTELNFAHADIGDIAILEVVQVFGGTKIIIPPDWEVTTEMAAIFGGIDDKRIFQPQGQPGNKKLIIKGTSVFGGIDIKSF